MEIIEGAAGYWEKDAGAYVLRRGKKLLRGQQIGPGGGHLQQ